MMFQKSFDGAGALCGGGQTPTSNMSRTGVEDSFTRQRRQRTARKNRNAAGYSMFSRKSHV